VAGTIVVGFFWTVFEHFKYTKFQAIADRVVGKVGLLCQS